MPDLVSLSVWVRGFNEGTMLQRFEQLLRVFPFSRLHPGISGLRVYAIDLSEAVLLERVWPEPPEIDEVIETCREFEHDDCAYVVDAWWEMFRFEDDWELKPAQVTLACYGPAFENEEGDHLRIEFGAEDDFIPRPEVHGSDRAVRSNLQSVVRLAHDIEQVMPVQRRRLWSESGENLAELLEIGTDL